MAASLLISLSAAFGLLYFLWSTPPPTRPRSDYALSLVDAAGRNLSDRTGSLQLMLDPFTVYRNAPNQRTSSYWIDEHGFRGGLGPGRAPRVFVVGGSAVFGLDLPADQDTLTAQLSNGTTHREFVNAGVVGYLSGQELASLVHYLDDHHPSGVIVFDGWNELFDQWLFRSRPATRLGFNNTFFEVEDRLCAQCRLATGKPSEPHSATPTMDSEQVFEDIVRAHLRNLEKMDAFARARGMWLLVAPQPEIGDRQQLHPAENRALEDWNAAYGYSSRGFSNAYGNLVDRVLEFCLSKQIPVVAVGRDPRFRESREALLLDPVHLSSAGASLCARLLLESLDRVSPSADGSSRRPESVRGK